MAELLAFLALLFVFVDQANDVLGHLIGDDLVAAQLTAPVRGQAKGATQVDLETLDAVALGIGNNLALQANVRYCLLYTSDAADE